MSKAQQEGGRVWEGRKGRRREFLALSEKGCRRREEGRGAGPAHRCLSQSRESREKQHGIHFGILSFFSLYFAPVRFFKDTILNDLAIKLNLYKNCVSAYL